MWRLFEKQQRKILYLFTNVAYRKDHYADAVLVNRIDHVNHLDALLAKRLDERRARHTLDALAGDVVDVVPALYISQMATNSKMFELAGNLMLTSVELQRLRTLTSAALRPNSFV